jgi:hypothetical protein
MRSRLRRFLFLAAAVPGLAIASGATSYPAYQWHTFLGGDDNAAANKPAAAADSYGNVYLTGWTEYPWNSGSASTQSGYAYLTKISATGQTIWSQFYGAGLHPAAIALDSAGDIYIAGAGDIGDQCCQNFVLETDPLGNLGWSANFGGHWMWSETTVSGMTYNPADGNVYITGGNSAGWTGGGQAINTNNGNPSMYVLQVLASGGLGWLGFYNNPQWTGGSVQGQAIAADASSSLYVAGVDGGNAAIWKISNSGALAWEQAYSWTGTAYAVASYDASVYITGWAAGGANGPAGQSPLNAFSPGVRPESGAAFVLKLDTAGNYLWHTYYGGNNLGTTGAGIAVDGPTTVYVAGPGDLVGYQGAAPRYSGQAPAHFILQLNDAGTYQWHSLYGDTVWDAASSIAVDPAHDVYVAGWTGNGDNWTGDNNTPPLASMASNDNDAVFVMKFGQAVTAATTTAASSVAPIAYSPNSQSVNLSATVTSTSTVNSGTVSFALLGTAATTVSASVSGGAASTTFTVPGGTTVGSYTIQAVYNPGAGFAASSDSSQQLTIGKATPVVTWSDPAAIPVGTALGSTQLDATASVYGDFNYNPPPGWVLPLGNGQTLSVTFAAADETDYISVTKTVHIDVFTCAITGDAAASIADVQLSIDEALGTVASSHDLNGDGVVNIADVQKVIGAALGMGCT